MPVEVIGRFAAAADFCCCIGSDNSICVACE